MSLLLLISCILLWPRPACCHRLIFPQNLFRGVPKIAYIFAFSEHSVSHHGSRMIASPINMGFGVPQRPVSELPHLISIKESCHIAVSVLFSSTHASQKRGFGGWGRKKQDCRARICDKSKNREAGLSGGEEKEDMKGGQVPMMRMVLILFPWVWWVLLLFLMDPQRCFTLCSVSVPVRTCISTGWRNR
jgi:hypothetical protein